MRDLLIFALVLSALPTAFRRPYLGLLLFSWLAYMRPQDLCWGFARDMRFSFLVGLVMIAGWYAHESSARRFWRPEPRTIAMLVLGGLVTVSLALAGASVGDAYVMHYYFEFLKIIVVALFTTGQVDSRQRLRWILWTIAASLGFYGIKNGVLGVLAGGAPILRGPGGMLEDNNDFALALVMNIPLLFYLGRSEGKLWVRRLTDVAVLLSLVTILLTHSRGAFVACVGMVAFMAWRARRLLHAVGVLALATALFFLLVPQHVLDRIATIAEGASESSAGARIKVWGVALQMIGDHPLLGVGLRNFQYHYAEYAPSFVPGQDQAYVAHSSYLQIWAEGGTPAFLLYLGLLLSVFAGCHWLRRLARAYPHLDWVPTYASMFEATTVGFLIGAVFLNRGHFDLIYHWLALLSCAIWVARQEAVRGPARAAAAARGIEARWRPAGRSALQPRWG